MQTATDIYLNYFQLLVCKILILNDLRVSSNFLNVLRSITLGQIFK